MTDENPYEAPESIRPRSPRAGRFELASRGLRLLGAILDGLAVGVVQVPILLGLGFLDFGNLGAQQAVGVLVLMWLIGLGTFLLVQGWLLPRGQTVGKLMFGMRIVDIRTNEPPGFGRVFGMRYLPTMFLSSIPLIGPVVGLVDALMIFRADRRCLHDLIASTRVIEVSARKR
ncbi:MAG: RDD family protein [Planctomycetes bacterium]|nr:RDD family protein [Planctomycetota bacterium]